MEQEQDQAWVTVSSKLSPKQLSHFCTDIERLLRINPLLEIKQWSSLGDGRYQFQGKNLSNEQELSLEIQIESSSNEIRIDYSDGLKAATLLEISPQQDGASLTIRDDYSGCTAEEREERLDEVDRSLVPWGHALHRYLVQWKRWSWFSPWRWYMRRIWQPMTPSSRRIANMVVVVTGLEFVAFLMVFTIFWLELDHFFAL